MRILVLGGYGLIGSEICRTLFMAGHEVVSLSRTPKSASRLLPQVEWLKGDMRRMLKASDWNHFLDGVDAVVNAASALQDSLLIDLEAVHHLSVQGCLEACSERGIARFVQISSTGAEPNAPTAFMRTKALGDDAVMDSSIDWVILRPGLVLAPSAYSGTALLRFLAGFPYFQPMVMADRRMQTIHVDELTEAALMAVEGRIPAHADIDLVEAESHSFEELVAGMRNWLGFSPAAYTIRLSERAAHALSGIANVLGQLGWRSPLRSTSMQVLEGHVTGDPSLWHSISGRYCRSYEETLAIIPSTTQERWFSKLALMLPVLIVTLSLFWIATGVITLCQMPQAASLLTASGATILQSQFLLASAAFIDIGLGAAILVRNLAQRVCLAMILMTLVYLVSATILVPQLWIDPLGSLLKAVPAMMLALITRSLLTGR
ncbi:SDR family oxidoreductase [Cohaesibacter celericrescens]|uniref:NADH-ubiquinone oxidoreductase n=1 Tax=Cohaesibacter celericrescens TaxID=2067669 RepID=A0A2N5XR85_9HYPH|nr:SDR family oxidoreductase [Cohaesibacter celericrescens]PLW77021.1 NADH-ubiquinone oxidoreductase [Cohaesibacter celericrescens]